MVRAFGLLSLLVGLVLFVGCGSEGARQVALSPAATPAEPGLPLEQEIAELQIEDPFAPPVAPTAEQPLPALDVDAAPVAVELSTMAEETAPRNDLMKTIGSFSGTGVAGRGEAANSGSRRAMLGSYGGNVARAQEQIRSGEGIGPGQGGDKFSHLEENTFLTVKDSPLSTFSIDVDTAS